MGRKKGVKTGRKSNWCFRGHVLTDEQMQKIAELDLSYHCVRSRVERGLDLNTAISAPKTREVKLCPACGEPAMKNLKYVVQDMELRIPVCKRHSQIIDVSESAAVLLEVMHAQVKRKG